MSRKSNGSEPTPPLLDPEFLADLRCPLSLRPLVLEGDMLYCYESRKAYPIKDGIPVLIIEEAIDIPEAELPEEYRGKPAVTSREGADGS